MFINFSNHPSGSWSERQRQEAMKYGEIRDLAFPVVLPMATKQEVSQIADHCTSEILKMKPDCVMCQGEFSLTMAVIGRLQAAGILCVCACSERKALETRLDDGTIQKTSIFEFRQFREYDRLNE